MSLTWSILTWINGKRSSTWRSTSSVEFHPRGAGHVTQALSLWSCLQRPKNTTGIDFKISRIPCNWNTKRGKNRTKPSSTDSSPKNSSVLWNNKPAKQVFLTIFRRLLESKAASWLSRSWPWQALNMSLASFAYHAHLTSTKKRYTALRRLRDKSSTKASSMKSSIRHLALKKIKVLLRGLSQKRKVRSESERSQPLLRASK